MNDQGANHVGYERIIYNAKKSLEQGHVHECLAACQGLITDSTIPPVFRVQARLLLIRIFKRQADQWIVEADTMWAEEEARPEVLRKSEKHFMKTSQHYVPRTRKDITSMQRALFAPLHIWEDTLDHKDYETGPTSNVTNQTNRTAPSQRKFMEMIARAENKLVSGEIMECLTETVGILYPEEGEEAHVYLKFVAQLLRTHCYLRSGQLQPAETSVQEAYNLWERKSNYICFYASCERGPWAIDFVTSHSAMQLEEWLGRTITLYNEAKHAMEKGRGKKKE